MGNSFKILLIGVIILMTNFNMNAQNISEKEVSRLITKARKKFNIPAIAVTIIDADSIVIKEIQGTRVVGSHNPVTFHDYFHIGSCSKSVLALMAGKLVETGKIKWETKFFDLFPEIKSLANNHYTNITLEDLFLCEAGIQPFVSGNEKFPDIDSIVQNKRYEFIKYLIQQPPVSKLKTNGKFEHLYSNASYTMAAAMLEKVSGKTYEQFVKHTFKALGMDVYVGWPNELGNNQPWGHLISNKKTEAFPPDHEYKLPHLLIPAGDLSLKPLDFAKYTQMHLQGLTGKDNYITSNSFQKIHFEHKGFSLGVGNGELFGHIFSGMDGSAGTFFCRAIIVPKSDFAFTVMLNAGTGTGQMKAVDWLTMKIVKKNYNWWWKFWL